MDQIVFQYDNEARMKVIQLKNIEFVLLFMALAIIIFELLFIFRPIAHKISSTINELVKSENLARGMAREITILYSSLEKSYQELADVQVEIEQPAVYFKTDASGNFISNSEKFCKIMGGTPDELPQNLFKWLEAEGYGADHLANIEKMVSRGDAWYGEVKVTSCEGDFLWFNMSIVPVLSLHQKIDELIIV
jgi:PAS domain S-box-containing protein